jgi:hypothetical protein
MFWRFVKEGHNRDKLGRTYKEAFRYHARWCLETLYNNVPDEQAMDYILDNSPTCIACPVEFKKYFAGDAVFNAYSEIKDRFVEFRQFYTPEEIAWIEGWINNN